MYCVPVNHTYAFVGECHVGQLAHENNEYFTPRKLPAIR